MVEPVELGEGGESLEDDPFVPGLGTNELVLFAVQAGDAARAIGRIRFRFGGPELSQTGGGAVTSCGAIAIFGFESWQLCHRCIAYPFLAGPF